MSRRKMRRISFFDLSDITGHIQLCVKRDDFGEEEYKKLHETLDIGDFIGVRGDVFTTQAGKKQYRFINICF